MNPFKWAKQQVKQFFDKTQVAIVEAKEAIDDAKPGLAKLTWAERNALRDKRKGWAWFWVSTKDIKQGDRTVRRSMTYNAGRNVDKRVARSAAAIARRKRMWEHSPRQVALSVF